MHALQRVQRSRSIGFSCAHAASNAPSHPVNAVMRPENTGKFRSAGNSAPVARPVTTTVTASCGASTPAQCSAACAGPTISNRPSERYDTGATGSGSGNPASANSAAIFGVAARASADHPPVSRMLTKRIVCVRPPSSATSPKSRASCVHATTTSPPDRSANAESSFWHSIVLTAGVPDSSSARASAAASSAIVPLHEQRCSVLSSRLIASRAGPAFPDRRSDLPARRVQRDFLPPYRRSPAHRRPLPPVRRRVPPRVPAALRPARPAG